MKEQTSTEEVENPEGGAEAPAPEDSNESAGSDQEGSKDSSTSEAASTSESTPETKGSEVPAKDGGEPKSPAEPESEEDLEAFLKAKGVDPKDPEAVKKVTKMLKDREGKVHEQGKQVSELKNKLTEMTDQQTAQDLASDDPVRKELGELRQVITQQAIKNFTRDFYEENGDLKAYDAQIAELVAEKPILAHDPEALAAVARSRFITDSAVQAATEKTRRETLEKVNKQQSASGPAASATNPSPGGSNEDDAFLQGFDKVK